MKKDFIIAYYDDEEVLVHAAEKVVDKNIKIYDVYSPFPIHGIDDSLGIKRSILPYITLVGGCLGLGVALALQILTSAVDWPINVGGKPFNSIPAFIPVSFELTILFAAHITVGAFLFLNKLYPGKKAVIIDPRQTCHKFIMAIEKSGNNADDVTALLTANGAVEVKVQNLDLNP